MSYLLDTCAFLWLVYEPEKLSRKAADLVLDEACALRLSMVSVWEMAVKWSKKRLILPEPPSKVATEQCVLRNIELLPMTLREITTMERLPFIHADPFDRMLVAQALTHGLAILTPDVELRHYPVSVVW